MIRAPSYLDDNTSTFARTCPGFGKTQAQMAVAIHVYRKPLYERILIWLLFRWGWALLLGAVLLLSGCADDVHAYAAAQADLADAIADAAKEAGK